MYLDGMLLHLCECTTHSPQLGMSSVTQGAETLILKLKDATSAPMLTIHFRVLEIIYFEIIYINCILNMCHMALLTDLQDLVEKYTG